ncbi:hypothetical protein PAXRUDRAFT_335978 [Paxillus rubicundulus Ve08.2h10]|uniref:Uncharacterized protein n=1 Tax=Paxillus rubicundulus Ve08.2h10 TaxID=930991 RepID=A0A0D0D3X6_9AGAM|nr:hypothetical protein PAXRUDRAFT_335978 [Paxillus rubicundulus Ve08.2h10]
MSSLPPHLSGDLNHPSGRSSSDDEDVGRHYQRRGSGHVINPVSWPRRTSQVFVHPSLSLSGPDNHPVHCPRCGYMHLTTSSRNLSPFVPSFLSEFPLVVFNLWGFWLVP